MLLNFETKSSNISVMHVADNGELKVNQNIVTDKPNYQNRK